MTLFHAVALIDHHSALVQQFDPDEVHAEKVKDHKHYTRQHGSAVRTEHEFFGEVCDALADIPEILIAGGHEAQADFRHYIAHHRPALASKIVGWETVDHPTDAQLVALARKFFSHYDRGAAQTT
ncbi:MAG: hypothetical protein ABUS57_02895 [Pseudomonadota bacterium]